MNKRQVPTYLVNQMGMDDSAMLRTLVKIREECSPRTDVMTGDYFDYYADMTLMLAAFLQKDE